MEVYLRKWYIVYTFPKMFATTRFLMDSMNSTWNQQIEHENIDMKLEYAFTTICTTVCIITALPFATMYDIGYDIGYECTRSVPIQSDELMQIAPRRSARLAETVAGRRSGPWRFATRCQNQPAPPVRRAF